jgi:hypothetical protein
MVTLLKSWLYLQSFERVMRELKKKDFSLLHLSDEGGPST